MWFLSNNFDLPFKYTLICLNEAFRAKSNLEQQKRFAVISNYNRIIIYSWIVRRDSTNLDLGSKLELLIELQTIV